MKIPGTICEECFSLKLTDHGTKVRCDKNKFREHLQRGHPFTTLPRDCKVFEDDPIEEKINIGNSDEDGL